MRKITNIVHDETGSTLIIALIFVVLLSVLGASMLAVSGTETAIGHNERWSEGAFYAAEAGLQQGVNQLSANQTTSAAAIASTNISDGHAYRSGGKDDTSAQPLALVGTGTSGGYSVNLGTGYNRSVYVFYTYQINATGSGPRNATREVEAQVEYGPVPR